MVYGAALGSQTVESIFYMWRLTKDVKYREWGWRIAKAIEAHAKTPYGYVPAASDPGMAPTCRLPK